MNVRTPVEEGAPHGLDPFAKRILADNIFKELIPRMATVQKLDEEGKWCIETIGFVLLKD